jgi:hypothetical protein
MADKTPKTTKPKKKTTTTAAPRKSSSSAPRRYTSTKPLFRGGTITALVTFILVVAVAVYISQKKETDAATATPEGGETAYVFTEADGAPVGIKIEPSVGEPVQLDRNDQNLWELTLPTKAEADQGMAEAAATQVSAISIVTDEIKGNAADFGLDEPAYVITITFADGQTHKLEVGDSAVTNNGYYVRLDKARIMLVSLSAIDALTQLVIFPPYLNPPTPTALPATETPVPVLDTPTISPVEVTVTPTP